jgi:hypothetical protein
LSFDDLGLQLHQEKEETYRPSEPGFVFSSAQNSKPHA